MCRVSTLTLRDIYLFSLERRQNKVLRWIVTFMLGGVRGLGTQQCSFDQLEFNKVTNQSKLSVIALNNFYRFGDLIHSLNDLITLCFLWLVMWCGLLPGHRLYVREGARKFIVRYRLLINTRGNILQLNTMNIQIFSISLHARCQTLPVSPGRQSGVDTAQPYFSKSVRRRRRLL